MIKKFLWLSIVLIIIVIGTFGMYSYRALKSLEENNLTLKKDLAEIENSNLDIVTELVNKKVAKLSSSINSTRKDLEAMNSKNKIVDSKQDELLSKNTSQITNIKDDISNNIKSELVDFDGKFNSLEANVNDNRDYIDELVNTYNDQVTLNDQFNSTIDSMQSNIDNVTKKEFQTQINKINNLLIDEIIPDVTKLEMLSEETVVNANDIDDLNMKYDLLSDDTVELAKGVIDLVGAVDETISK